MLVIGTILFAIAISIGLNIKFENIFGTSVVLIAIFVNFFLAIDKINYSVHFFIIVAAVSFAYIIIKIIKKADFKSLIFSYGAIFIFLCIIIIFFFDYGRQALYGPDPLFWVGTLKKLYLTNSKGTVIDSSYPYLLWSFGYLAEKLECGWNEWIFIFSKDYFMLALISNFFSFKNDKIKEEKNQLIFNLFVMGFIVVYAFIGSQDSFGTIIVDGIMAASIVMGVIFLNEALITQDLHYYFTSIIYFIAGILSKRIAIAVVALFIAFLMPFLYKIGKAKVGVFFAVILMLSYILLFRVSAYAFIPVVSVCLLCIYFLLKTHFKFFRINISTFKIYVFILIVVGVVIWCFRKIIGLSSFRSGIAKTYIRGIITSYKYALGSIIPLSVGGVLLISVLISIYLKKYHLEKTTIVIFDAIILSCIGYLVVFLCLYVTIIGPSQYESTGEYTPAFARYMSLPTMLIIGYLFYCAEKYISKIDNLFVIFLAVLFIADAEKISDYFLFDKATYYYSWFKENSELLDENTKIAYVVKVDSDFDLYACTEFAINCIPSEADVIDILQYEKDDELDYCALIDTLKLYDYIYVNNVEDCYYILDGNNRDESMYIYNCNSGKFELY